VLAHFRLHLFDVIQHKADGCQERTRFNSMSLPVGPEP